MTEPNLRGSLERTRDILTADGVLILEHRATAIAACVYWLEQLDSEEPAEAGSRTTDQPETI